jgi:hypothetical protein
MKKDYTSPALKVEEFESTSIMALVSGAAATGSTYNETDPGWN